MSRATTRYLLERLEQKRQQKLDSMTPEQRQQFLAEEDRQIEIARAKYRRQREFRQAQIDRMAAEQNAAWLIFFITIIAGIIFFS
jgi:hypothetical protein